MGVDAVVVRHGCNFSQTSPCQATEVPENFNSMKHPASPGIARETNLEKSASRVALHGIIVGGGGYY